MIPFGLGFFKKKSDAFSPVDISNGVYWIDATEVSNFTLNGGNVSAITDKFGVTNWEQTTASLQPPYISGAYMDLKDASRLDSVTAVDLSANNKAVSISFVIEPNENLSSNNGILLESSSNYNSRNDAFVLNFQKPTANRLIASIRDGNKYIADKLAEGGGWSWGTKVVFIIVFDKSEVNNADKIKMYVNGVELSVTYLNTSTGNGTFGNYIHYLGARPTIVAGVKGKIYEVIAYNKALIGDDLSNLNTYLKNKHSIS